MFRHATLIATCLLLPLVAADPIALAPAQLIGEPTEAGFHLEWILPVGDVDGILVHVTNETGTTTLTLPGSVSEFVHPGTLGDVYVVQYQQGATTSAPSNPVQWGPLGYPYCGPTSWVLIYDDPIAVVPRFEDCFEPYPI